MSEYQGCAIGSSGGYDKFTITFQRGDVTLFRRRVTFASSPVMQRIANKTRRRRRQVRRSVPAIRLIGRRIHELKGHRARSDGQFRRRSIGSRASEKRSDKVAMVLRSLGDMTDTSIPELPVGLNLGTADFKILRKVFAGHRKISDVRCLRRPPRTRAKKGDIHS